MILIDSGPLVAIVDRSDQYHRECTGAAQGIRYPIGTVWPVLTEAMHFLGDLPEAQDAVWTMVERRKIKILDLGHEDVPRIRELMDTYADLPMDLADAALVRVAEREGYREFFTVDRRDFGVYRLHGRIKPKLLP